MEGVREAASPPVSGGDVLGPDDASGESYDGGAFLEVDVHPEGTVRYAGVLHLIPAFFVELLGNNTSIPIADIPISLPENEQHWVFDAERVHAPVLERRRSTRAGAAIRFIEPDGIAMPPHGRAGANPVASDDLVVAALLLGIEKVAADRERRPTRPDPSMPQFDRW